MSRNRRESHGLGRIFAQPEVQPTPNKQHLSINRSAKKSKPQHGALHDSIWDQTSKVTKTTPRQQAQSRRQSVKPLKTPIQSQVPGDHADATKYVYSLLAETGFEAQTGGSIPKNPIIAPMNTDIVKMFSFLFQILEPGHENMPIAQMLENLGYTGMDQSFKRAFATSHVLANTASIWPKIVKALKYVAELINASRTAVLPASENEQDQIKLLQEAYIFARFCGYDSDTQAGMLKGLLTSIEAEEADSQKAIDSLNGDLKVVQQDGEKFVKMRALDVQIAEDLDNLRSYFTKQSENVKTMEQDLEKINLELITSHELFEELEKQKNSLAYRFERAGVSLSNLEDCNHQQKLLQEDLDGLKQRVFQLEQVSKSYRETIIESRQRIKGPLEQLCEELNQTVPDEEEWSKTILDLISSLDGLRRDLLIKTSAIQESVISEKASSAAFNSQFDVMQSSQVRLEAAVKNMEEQNASKVRQLEIKTALINQRTDVMKRHCADLLRAAQQEHSLTNEQHLHLEQEGVQLDSKALENIHSITDNARKKLQLFITVQDAIDPSVRQLCLTAAEYSKTASKIAKATSQINFPEPFESKGTNSDQVGNLMRTWLEALDAAL